MPESGRFPRRFGEYLLLEPLAEGASSACLARHLASGSKLPSPLVIKRLSARLGADPERLKRLEHEGAVAVAIDSRYLVRVFEVGVVGDEPYIAMEHVPGVPLADVFAALNRAQLRLSIEVIATLFAGALEGLHELHTAMNPKTREPFGDVYRDLSPRNLLITPDGQLRLLDLGLGKSNIPEWEARTGVVLGSLGYMSPEHVLRKRVDARSDLYMLALAMHELITGRPYIEPADGVLMMERMGSPLFMPAANTRPDAPPELDLVLQRALAVRPEDRYASAIEMLAALRDATPHASGADRAELVATMNALAGLALSRAPAKQTASQPPAGEAPPPTPAPSVEKMVTLARRAPSTPGAPPLRRPSSVTAPPVGQRSPWGSSSVVIVVLLLAAAGLIIAMLLKQ